MKAPVEEKQESSSITNTTVNENDANTSNSSSGGDVDGGNDCSNNNGDSVTISATSSNCSFIKPSLSMTSLRPKEQQDGREVIKAKLRMERPYNSLKKKRNSDVDIWRHSWGSGHSHSSCSLHSNATGGGFSIGKDDFWAALQTNYNYIMDTNLLDTCKEARCEIEGATSTLRNTPECCQKRCLQSSQPEGTCEDPKELRKWLREMENKLSKAPSLSEATQMSIAELQRRLAEHSVLYCEIVSHARVVGACVRASEKEYNNCNNIDNSLSSEEKTSSPNTKQRIDGNLKGLERRYHLLYLKAIEVQCLFEGLLGKKNSSSVLSRASSTETDDEPASKLARLSDSETNTRVSCDLLSSTQQTISDENKSEDDDGEDWPDLGEFNTHLNTDEFHANADFDADSEGSDSEIIKIKIKESSIRNCGGKKDKQNYHHYYYHHHHNHHNNNYHRLIKLKHNNINKNNDSIILSENMDSNSYQSCGSVDFVVSEKKLQNSNNCSPKSAKSVIVTTPTSIITTTTTTAATSSSSSASSIKKRQRNIDASKFNRSNRKSKNCAIFYFKHLDTDNENFGISSQGSDVIKSGEPSSDDEGWLFSNDCIDGKHPLNDDSDKENKDIECSNSIGNCTIGEIQKITAPTTPTTPTTPTIPIITEITAIAANTTKTEENDKSENEVLNNMNAIEMELNSKDVSQQDSSNLNCGIVILNEENEYEVVNSNTATVIMATTTTTTTTAAPTSAVAVAAPSKSGSNHLKGEIDVDAVTIKKIVSTNNVINKSPTMITKITNAMATTKSTKPITTTTTTAAITTASAVPGIKTKLEMSVEMSNKECSHESIKQLVLDAENLVRDEILRTPNKRHAKLKNSASIKKREINMPGPNIKRVQEWLEHQPISTKDGLNPFSTPTTDCEASGEYTESDSAARESDTSEGFTDSVATCMQTGGSTSQCTSTEIIGGSAEPIVGAVSNPNLNTGGKVVRRTNRRSSDRPWSVSCLSQLTESETIKSDKVNTNQDLASHSVSETALHILSSSPGKKKNSSQVSHHVKNSDSKNSLRRRKARRRKMMGRKSDSGSDGILPYDLPKLTQTLMKSESINGQINIIQDLTMALEMISLPKAKKAEDKSPSEIESEEEPTLMKPNFKLGSYTSAYMTNESKLGSLAALANYMNEEQGEYQTGTEDHSSFSEQAWDNYQEKYNSENYSEGFDSDAARKLLEFGDDYRNFLDSQSDCCSSLSAANNFDSLSPPQMDSLKQHDMIKITQQTITSSVDHARRRRALELQYERRRKNSEMKKKSQDDVHHLRSPNTSSSTLHPLSPRSADKNNTSRSSNGDTFRKLDFDFNFSTQSLRRTSESDNNSTRRRKSEDALLLNRRRSSKTLEKSFKPIPSTSSSSNDESDDEKEMKNLLSQSRNRLENTNALKIRSHLLRPEDYAEIVATCRDNIRCLESVLRGPPGTMLSSARINETRDLLSSWENLLGWSENASAARKMQEEMVVLKNALNRLGRQTCEFDSESSIQFTIEELKNEKAQLQTYRTNMLRLNASVHSWLTRQELKLKKELEALVNETENNNNNANNTSQEKGLQIDSVMQSENEFHKHLKDEVSDMYSAWDEADIRINSHLEALSASIVAWRQLEFGLSEFHQVLGKDRGTLKGLEGALDRGQATPSELAQNVKLVAKLLSEKIDCNQHQQVTISSQEQQDPNRILSITQFTSSNGSLSDSGISDGGATSDGGLSERERRLGVLRRLAKQLENALAPGSEALKSIAARMEAAEAELKTLQNTCRELIVRTAVSQHKKSQAALVTYTSPLGMKSQQKNKKSPPSKRKTARRRSLPGTVSNASLFKNSKKSLSSSRQNATAPDSGDPDDPRSSSWDICNSDDDDGNHKGGWAWRVAKIALPMQLALFTLFCAACLMEPHCCDSLNTLSMSFTPQLRYIRGPPPI